MRKFLLALTWALILLAVGGPSHAADYYDEIYLGDDISVRKINNLGDYCGFDGNPGTTGGFSMIDDVRIDHPNNAQCFDLNENGQILLRRQGRDPVTNEFFIESFIYEPVLDSTGSIEYVIRPIEVPAPYDRVEAEGMNNSLQVVGRVREPTGPNSGTIRGFVWDPTNGFRLQPAVTGDGWSITDNGLIGGRTANNFGWYPFDYDLSTGVLNEYPESLCSAGGGIIFGVAINDSGQMAGHCLGPTPEFSRRPFVFKNGALQILSAGVRDVGQMYAINNDGIAVGDLAPGGNPSGREAVIWDQANGVRFVDDLRLPWNRSGARGNAAADIVRALDINHSGQIIAAGVFGASILTPLQNVPPRLDFIQDQSVLEDMQLSFMVSASDLDNIILSFSARNVTSGAPDNSLATLGATLDPSTGVFDWTPGFDQAGVYEIAFTATDDGQPLQSDTQRMFITVGNVNRPPVFDPVGPFDILVGETLVFQLDPVDPDTGGGARVETVKSRPLPTGAELQDGNFLYWTPDASQVDVHQLIFRAVDTQGAASEITVIVTVGAAILSPEELIEVILDEVDALPADPRDDLRDELLEALDDLLENDIGDAIEAVEDFQQEVLQLHEDGEISAETRDLLINLSNQLIELLQNP